MTHSARERQAALVCYSFGEEFAKATFEGIEGPRAATIRELLSQFEDAPPSSREVNQALVDFEVFFKFAIDTLNIAPPDIKVADKPTSFDEMLQEEEEVEFDEQVSGGRGGGGNTSNQKNKNNSKAELKVFVPGDDPIEDLENLHPFQVANALAGEYSRTIAIILNLLEEETTAQVIQRLPESVQPQVVIDLKSPLSMPDPMLQRMLKTTVEKASQIEVNEVDEIEGDQRLATLLRQMPKDTQARIMDELTKTDPESANRISELLFEFEDLVKYDNKSIQKLLSEVETQWLIVSLQDANEEIENKIFDNLSKRALESLQEEIAMTGPKPEAEIEASKKEIAKVIAKLDKEGTINLIPA